MYCVYLGPDSDALCLIVIVVFRWCSDLLKTQPFVLHFELNYFFFVKINKPNMTLTFAEIIMFSFSLNHLREVFIYLFRAVDLFLAAWSHCYQREGQNNGNFVQHNIP